jgi:2-polyprenyl-3-methyl-5-hydroxy-6-metoxy-1,4-benzoquinol methylase
MRCRICGNNEKNISYNVTEMMFGTKEVFPYFQCARCKCLQIAEIPDDMHRFYPKEYYSLSLKNKTLDGYRNSIKKYWKIRRAYYTIYPKGLFGAIMRYSLPQNRFYAFSRIALTNDSRILDVGCGTGWLLHDLKTIGFSNVLGIDPHINEPIEYSNGLKILNKSIHEMDGFWDLIMYHHSFEHISDPLEQLQKVQSLLHTGGICLIRIPTVSSYAWERYKTAWVQLDAPRHLFLYAIESINTMANKIGFQLKEVVYDSTELQFIGSELYVRNIPLIPDRSREVFSRKQRKAWRHESAKLNASKYGDQAAFYLVKN